MDFIVLGRVGMYALGVIEGLISEEMKEGSRCSDGYWGVEKLKVDRDVYVGGCEV